MSTVIGLSEFLHARVLRAAPSAVSRQASPPSGFTRRDRADLDEWSNAGHQVSICSSELGTFATLHEAGQPWSSWGVVRQGRSVLLWDCVSLADIGSFPSMIDALAAVPTDDLAAPIVPVANVIQFSAGRARAVWMEKP